VRFCCLSTGQAADSCMYAVSWEIQQESFLSAIWLVYWDSKAKVMLLAALLTPGCALVSVLSHGPVLLGSGVRLETHPSYSGSSLRSTTLVLRGLGGRRQGN